MKAASAALKAFLVSTQTCVKPNLYTITLSGGAVLRYTDADIGVTSAGLYYAPANVSDTGVRQSRGTSVDSLRLTFAADDRHVVNGVPLLQFIRKNGFDGASVRVERAYAIDWDTLASAGPVGTTIRFAGRYSEVTDGGRTEVTVQVASWMELLNVNMPADVYQGSCLNTLFDTNCGVPRASYAASGTVGSGAPRTVLTFASNLSAAAGYYDQGAVIFLTGPNAGLRRSIRSQAADGRLVLSLPLPTAPGAGDTFTAYPGCNLSLGAGGCAKFANTLRFRGQPFIPEPETAI